MKTISIIGSCVTRNLFNYDILLKNCKVDFYAFQTNVWDMFSEGLDIPINTINKVPIENFFKRMFSLDVNKKFAEELAKAKSDYLVIDLFTVSKDILKVSYNNKYVYINNNAHIDFMRFYNAHKEYDINIDLVPYQQVDMAMIKRGLDKFADFIKKNYKLENVIINYPYFNTKYENANRQIVSYSENGEEEIVARKNIVYECSDYLCSLLDGCKRLIPEFDNSYSVIMPTDAPKILPNPVHNNRLIDIKILNQMLTLLDIQQIETEVDCLLAEYQKLNLQYCELIQKYNNLKKSNAISLNSYVENRIDLNRYIVIISVKHEASTKLHKFYNKGCLDLNMNIGKTQSYIAIVNKKANFLYEKVSNDMLKYEYQFADKNIEIVSAGAHCGNISSIMINGKDYSKNRRGLNFVILDNTTLEVVDSFFCDTYADEDVLISL